MEFFLFFSRQFETKENKKNPFVQRVEKQGLRKGVGGGGEGLSRTRYRESKVGRREFLLTRGDLNDARSSGQRSWD